MSHRILKKCHGLPLAIITIASLLAGKPTKEQWQQVYNSINSAFSHQGMADILLLSYYDLPQHLKTCLLYLSMFPEDYRIEKEELTWRWIAEGFITGVRVQTVDQVAVSYFNELVNRSLIQPIDIRYDGQAEACRVHDMVFDLIVSLSTKENFASIVEGQSYDGSGHKIRRLSIQHEHLGDEVMQDIMDNMSQVRSINFYGFHELGILHLQGLYSLRVLVYKNHSHLGNQHVKYVGSLFQLSFLSINSHGVTKLPEDIGDLRYLQTLDLRGSGITKLPASIGHLQKLMRLLVDGHVKLPNGIGDLQALQELSRAWISSIKIAEVLKGLTKLKTLGIYVSERQKFGPSIQRYEDALNSSLAMMGKHSLQSLHIFNYDFLRDELMDELCCTVPCLRKLVVHGTCITRLPKKIEYLVNLTHLSIWVYKIKQHDLYILGGIPGLLFCDLSVEHASDERLTISSQQFRCLKEFLFSSMFYGGGLEMLFLQEAMSELRRLHLQFRAQETEFKMGFEFSFEHLVSLEHIIVVIFRNGATRNRVEAAEVAIRNAVSIHPGCPTLDLEFGGPMPQ